MPVHNPGADNGWRTTHFDSAWRETHFVPQFRVNPRADAHIGPVFVFGLGAHADAGGRRFAVLAGCQPVGQLPRHGRPIDRGDVDDATLCIVRGVAGGLLPRRHDEDHCFLARVVEQDARLERCAERILLRTRLQEPRHAQAVRRGLTPRGASQFRRQWLTGVNDVLRGCIQRVVQRDTGNRRDVIQQRDGI